ncbi:monovalent cation:proton antiporter-2 (CPA2) family protein [Shimia haliotis]|uniref:Kef-type potassium/proton antiporter, CPA2 family (TC 2.A.37.1) n=1 Tax=Shimia haliotis TaxID=1280847 RepID=A0A1I4A351_9RHOB|nr:monovalent cation:proton antiporter-2 (CPA2) family protein [Shimia haliotis]SFK50189.1 Kef-type potassium/proton antiporter, CPA2 family (TC 2.A.37.1) [Shimia haliotis]
MEHALYTASIFLLTAVIAVPISARLGLGSVLGYLAAGILIGPVLGLVGTNEADELLHYAEFGVVMMLFLIGLEMDPRALWAMKDKLIGLGGLQIGITGLAVLVLVMSFGYSVNVAVACGMVFALSSTAIVLQTLTEKGLMRTQGGRSAFAVLLTQDIAVIPMLIILPLFADPTLAVFSADGAIQINDDHAHESMSLIEGLPGWGAALVTLAMVAAIIFGGRYLTRPVFRFIHAARLPEMYTALALLIVVGIAFSMTLVGLSPALGTFLAGVLLANSEFRHELESDIAPFKGLLLGLFFIIVGAQINFGVFLDDPLRILSITLGLIALKATILFVIGHAFGLRGRSQWLFTLSLAQAGEFGFVLITSATTQNVLPPWIGEELLLVVALSMLITPSLFIIYDQISKRFGEQGEARKNTPDEIDESGPVIIAGIGRFGQIVNRLVRSAGFNTVVLDHNMKTIETMRRFGVKGFFGDPTRPEMLHAAGISKASVLVVAMDDPEAAIKLVTYARRERPDLHIVARVHDRTQVFRMYKAGADDIVREMFDSSLRAGRYVLENIGLSEYEAAQAEQTFFHHDRDAVQELAQLWKEGVSSANNPEYMQRARELEEELETMLMNQLDGEDDDRQA